MMDPHFAFEVYKRAEIELTRRLEYERVARERIQMDVVPRNGWRSRFRRWGKAVFAFRVTNTSTVACCPTPAAC